MSAAVNEELLVRLPLPLAQLYRRAHNAKTALERHLTAYYLWEASLKLLASVAIVEYAESDDHDPALAERLQNLARPSTGHWWEFTRRLIPVLAETGDTNFRQLRDVLLGRSRDDLPWAAGLDAALREALEVGGGARTTVRLTELFDRLVQYRTREIGHGAAGQRTTQFYEKIGRALLAGVADVLGRLDVLAGRRLVYVADVRRQAKGSWLVECYELRGETARRMESVELPEQIQPRRLPNPQRVYLASADQQRDDAMGALRSLHPLVVYGVDSGDCFFLNGRRGKRHAEYLCYVSGDNPHRTKELDADRRELLARILGAPVDEQAVEAWSARSQAEEPASPGAADEQAGPVRTIREFELLSRIGRGGMGVVYRAWQPSLGRQVALKCLLRSGDPKAEARFAREIRALGRVEHEHLVKIFTSGVEGDQWFYAMELLEGADLAQVCEHLAGSSAAEVGTEAWQHAVSTACEQARRREEPLSSDREHESKPAGASSAQPPDSSAVLSRAKGVKTHIAQVVEIIRQVAEAAQALHEGGIVHRDIKPGNIILTPDGQRAVLMDLGLAQLADESEGRLTRTRQFVGTLRYASPEQVLAVRRTCTQISSPDWFWG